MADDEQRSPSMISGMAGEFITQQGRIAETLRGMAGSGMAVPGTPGAPVLPGTISAAQLASIIENVAAQRHSIETLKAQLASYDQQLVVLEQILGPLAEWTHAWAEFEQRLLNRPRGPGGGTGDS